MGQASLSPGQGDDVVLDVEIISTRHEDQHVANIENVASGGERKDGGRRLVREIVAIFTINPRCSAGVGVLSRRSARRCWPARTF